MKSNNRRSYFKWLTAGFLVLLTSVGFLYIDTRPQSADSLNTKNEDLQANLYRKPTHNQIYKLDSEMDIDEAFNAANSRKVGQLARRKSEIKAKTKTNEIEKERHARENTEKSAQEKPATYPKETTSTSISSSNANAVSSTQTGQKTQDTAKSKTSEPTPTQQVIGSNKIGINGVYKSYTNYGNATTEQLQVGIDAGQIVAGLTSFNGDDSQTTYFGGHNPGIMNFMAESIHTGAVITITDSNGKIFNYRMMDKAEVDIYGEGTLHSLGRSVIDVYRYGTNTDSIFIQFCNTNNDLMSFWYGIKI